MPGSYALGTLKIHFWAQCGLMCASLSIRCLLRTTRKMFIKSLHAAFDHGRINVAAWHKNDLSDRSCIHLVVGVEDEAGLVRIVSMVYVLCES